MLLSAVGAVAWPAAVLAAASFSGWRFCLTSVGEDPDSTWLGFS